MGIPGISFVYRNIKKSPFLNLLGILCLSIGLATCIYVFLWIRDELAFDRFHPRYNNIYRFSLKVDNKTAGYYSHFARSRYTWIYNMKEKIPGIEELTRLSYKKNFIVSKENQEAFRVDMIFTDQDIFNVFWFEFLSGNKEDIFDDPFSVIISESTARKIFGEEDPVGKTIEVYCDRCLDRRKYTVKGIVSDYPAGSHFHFDMIANIDNPDQFSDWAYYYLLLSDKILPSEILSKFSSFASGYIPEEEIKNLTPDLQSIKDIHLKSRKDREIELNGNYRNIWMFSGLALFVLLVALINFITMRQANLERSNLALSVMRIHGASRYRLLRLQLSESLLLSLISVIISMVLVSVFLPAFNVFTGKGLNIEDLWFRKESWFMISGLFVLSIISGIYPFLISQAASRLGRRDSRLIFSGLAPGRKKGKLTPVYLAMQFAVSLILIIIVITINRQLHFFMSGRLGKGENNIICIMNVPVQVHNNYQVFKSELEKNPLIYDITSSFEDPSDENMDMMSFETTDVAEDARDKLIFIYPADANFFEFYGIRFLAGRNFTPSFGNDTIPETYILNKRACDFLGWTPEQALEKPFILNFFLDGKNLFKGGIITGVVEDFQMSSMKNEIKPYVFFQKSFWLGSVQIRFNNERSLEALSVIKKEYESAFPGFPVHYNFLEDLYRGIYRNESQSEILSILLGIIAIILSLTGLWGNTAIIFKARSREISIRKANGAQTVDIFRLLISDINKIVLLAILIAIPSGYYLIKSWLDHYTLHIRPDWWFFILPVIFIYLTAILTVSGQVMRIARMNPITGLHYE